MASITYQQGGTARTITSLYYQDGATLRTITSAFYQDGATLRQVWPAIAVALTTHSISDATPGAPSTASIGLLNTGVAQGNGTTSGTTSFAPEWLSGGGSAASYDARWTNTSGAITVGTAATWQNLATSRSYGISRGAFGITTCSGTLEIRDASTLVVLATATINLSAEWA